MAESLVPERLLRRAERLNLRLRRPTRAAVAGEHRGPGQTTSLELSDHRAYAPGDDFRRVDWNAFARLDTLNLKLADPQQNLSVHVVVDCSASMQFGTPTKVRLAMQVAACLAYIALTQLDGVRIYRAESDQLARSPRLWGKGQAADALRRVQALEPGRSTDLAAVLAAFMARHPEPGIIVILSDLLSQTDFMPRLRQIAAAGFEIVIGHILSEAELHPILTGNIELVDAETGQRRRVGATPAALASYEAKVEAWRARTAADCRSLGARFVPLTSAMSIESVLLADLRREGVVE